MSVAWIAANFADSLDALRAHAATIVMATAGVGQRSWWMGNVGNWPGPGDVTDPAAAAAVFDRAETAEIYAAAVFNEANSEEGLTDADVDESTVGTTGDAASAKIQSDTLATMERAFRLATMSPVRCELAAAARRAGHALVNGPVGRTARVAVDFIEAGAG